MKIFDRHLSQAATKLVIALAVGVASLNLNPQPVYGQDYVAPPVSISKEKIKKDGKTYLSHVVMEKQTLYSISKAYGVGVDEIYQANPNLKDTGLKKNAIILIPFTEEENMKVASSNRNIQSVDTQTTRQREAKEGKEAKETKKNRNKDKGDYIIHVVKWTEDLNVIAEKYGVTVSEIQKANNLKGRKLSKRQKLRIPTGASEADENAESSLDTTHEYKNADEETVQGSHEESLGSDGHGNEIGKDFENFSPKTSINAVIMLPFNAMSAEKSNEGGMSMDFYSGALLAARELGLEGIDIDLSVYDTGNGDIPVTEQRLKMSDIIIGPMFSRELESVMQKVPENSYIISPIDPKAEKLADTYDNFIQVPSSSRCQYKNLIEWIAEENGPADRTVLIFEKNMKGREMAASIDGMMKKDSLKYSSFSYNILEGRNIMDSLSCRMSTEGNNRIIVSSDSEAFVNDVIRNLNIMVHNKYRVTLYCPSKVRSFETADVENLHNTGLHISSSYNVDYDLPATRDFLMTYRAVFNTEPSAFSYQGYDIMKYFATLCSKYGNRWPQMLTCEKGEMLQSDFIFEKLENGGYRNVGVRRIIYNPDFSVTNTHK